MVGLGGNPEEWLAAVILIAARHEKDTVVQQHSPLALVSLIDHAPGKHKFSTRRIVELRGRSEGAANFDDVPAG